ncbi:anhydro-N-acetylmuramic acid kinase [Denitratisoma oestradiolicum]|uniref:anhydro-N-acetylmuramic acid kinase n=1 Tax=Denitratisoma oestradiolicum TaxID=311182 RepID=UPI0011A9259A|nr:anhydro-N-acetylmuramic acid kinase [Denitratisoma oestradiolicum]TWO79767.1 anhydro-N-acetylmuramic acid kinase [Denitratisoma oestradiolicum]
METEFYIGLMSGTSLDGIDAALVCFSDGKASTLATHYIPYPEDVRREALALQSSGPDELHRTALLSNRLMHLHAEGVKALLAAAQLGPDRITAQGCHGQTLRHRPESGYTLQIGNPALLAELTGIAVVADFRSRDVAAGGQGAPLVPAAHAALFQSTDYHRLILNIGGIANITNLPLQGDTAGFDCGPGNMLLDGWASRHLGLPYDANGAWGQSGNVISGLLEKMLAHPFLDLTPPKSCGREQFGLPWLDGILTGTEEAADVQRCLLELTARSAADAVRRWCAQPERLYVCGGGARNGALMTALTAALPDIEIGLTDQLGVPADWVEAVAFAWLARQHVSGLPGNLPKVTGSQGPRVLGAYYPA